MVAFNLLGPFHKFSTTYHRPKKAQHAYMYECEGAVLEGHGYLVEPLGYAEWNSLYDRLSQAVKCRQYLLNLSIQYI